MKADSLCRRLAMLEEDAPCPYCQSHLAMTEEEIDLRLCALIRGEAVPKMLDPSPTCKHCQQIAAMNEEEIDAKLAKMLPIIKEFLGEA